jgi:pimeloyl-ACP methyl ester carboxylesterase
MTFEKGHRTAAAAAALGLLLFAAPSSAQTDSSLKDPNLTLGPVGLRGAPTRTDARSESPKPSIVLVHGAFADGSSWSEVIRILQKDGYVVTAVQNPLSSYAEDVATTKRLIDAQAGPVVVVGHSYGGAVMTGAAAGNTNVKALVFVAAFAPDANEPIGAYGDKYPSALGAALRPDAAGFVYIDRAAFRDVFAKDLPQAQTDIMAAAQKPAMGTLFGASPAVAAWRTIPSWYVVAQDDQAINPALERFFATRMGATTKEIKASHVVFISHANEVAQIIENAATPSLKP